jgi:hypothetical protein
VHAAAEAERAEAVMHLADVVLRSAEAWRKQLEQTWVRLDEQAAQRLEAFRAVESERGVVAKAYYWLNAAVENDAVAAIRGQTRYRFIPGPVNWVTALRGPNQETLSEGQLLDALEAVLSSTGIQSRLDEDAAEAARRDEENRALRAERERHLDEARKRQSERLQTVRAAESSGNQADD